MKKFSKTFPGKIADFIAANNYGKTLAEITALVNETFGTSYGQNQLRAYRENHNLKSGLTGRFEKGHIPQNKYQKGYCPPGCEKGWFKSGFRPHNAVPVGTEVMATTGYIKIKIAEPNVWRFKHIMEWEKHHGKVPDGMIISFKDGDHNNCRIENLMMISRSENATLNRFRLRSEFPEITETGLTIARLKHRISTIQKDTKSKACTSAGSILSSLVCHPFAETSTTESPTKNGHPPTESAGITASPGKPGQTNLEE